MKTHFLSKAFVRTDSDSSIASSDAGDHNTTTLSQQILQAFSIARNVILVICLLARIARSLTTSERKGAKTSTNIFISLLCFVGPLFESIINFIGATFFWTPSFTSSPAKNNNSYKPNRALFYLLVLSLFIGYALLFTL
jgi:hypothetical protein